jgi:glucokinase
VRQDPEAGQTLLDLAGSRDAITGRTVNDALAQGDPLAHALTEATSRYLGAGMTSVVNTLNPERIVMGGGVIEGHPAHVDAVAEIVRERALPPARQRLDIVPSELGGQAGVVGAAAYARHQG